MKITTKPRNQWIRKLICSSERYKHLSLLLFTIAACHTTGAQISYTFTPCGATGSLGPTQGMVNTAYASTNLNGLVTINTQGIQEWTIPSGGAYRIEVWGAQGGNHPYPSPPGFPGGKGAYLSGEFTFTTGTVLKVVVGQKGQDSHMAASTDWDNAAPGGGGGSFVFFNATDPAPLMAAGGGGAGGRDPGGLIDASIGVNGNPALWGGIGGMGLGGVAGNGGQPNSGGNSYWAGGGGGWLTDGTAGNQPTPYVYNGGTGGSALGGRAPRNGAMGGSRYNDNSDEGGDGGFGGGGGGGSDNMGTGGGGGYSGGGGANTGLSGNPTGGGGGSFNGGTNQTNTAGIRTGDGLVVITRLCNVSLTPAKNPICQGESTTLSTNAVSGILWLHNGSTAPSVNVSPTSNTTYTLIGQAASGCTISLALTVTVNPVPVMSAAVVPSVLCVGKTATATATGANSFTWTSFSLSGPTATMNPVVTTNYSYSGTNQYGCTSSTMVAVIVNTNVLGITPGSTICSGNSILLTASNAVTYTWSTGNNFPSTPVAPLSNTVYAASGTDIHNCITSNSVAITVNARPNVTANTSKNTICLGESTDLIAAGADTYTWSSSAGTGSQVTINPSVDVLYNYTVTGTGTNGCTNTAVTTVKVNRCTGIETVNASSLKVYPNPTSDEIYIQAGNSLLDAIEVTDLSGRIVISLSGDEIKNKVDLRQLSPGIYHLKIKTNETREVVKIIKE